MVVVTGGGPIQSSIVDPDHFGKLDPGPLSYGKQDLNPHRSEKVEALEGNFGSIGGSKSGK